VRRTPWVVTGGILLGASGLLAWAVRVNENGAFANLLADLIVVGVVTVGARSWFNLLRRTLFTWQVDQSQNTARLSVENWVQAQRGKAGQYRHLVGLAVDATGSHRSYRECRTAAMESVTAFDLTVGKDDELRRALHDVGLAEQAAKWRRLHLHDVLDSVFREWVAGISPAAERECRGRLPSQVGLPGLELDEIRREEARLVRRHGEGRFVEEYLAEESAVGDELVRLRATVERHIDRKQAALEHVPELLPRGLKLAGWTGGILATATWVGVAAVSWLSAGHAGTFSGDVLNNLLCALAVAIAGVAIGIHSREYTLRRRATSATPTITVLFDALDRSAALLRDIIDHDSRVFFCATGGEIERGRFDHLITTEHGNQLARDLQLIREELALLQDIHPDKRLTRLEDQLSDRVNQFVAAHQPLAENLLKSAQFLMNDIRDRVASAYSDVLNNQVAAAN